MTSKVFSQKNNQAFEAIGEIIEMLQKSTDKNARVQSWALAFWIHTLKNVNNAAIQQMWLLEQKQEERNECL